MAGGKPAGKADPKKDAKGGAPPKKGGAPAEDKNAPKTVNIDYPDAPAAPTYCIYEKSFAQMKISLLHEEDVKHTGTATQSKKAAAKEVSAEEKKTQRTKELLKEYHIVRGYPFTLTVKSRFNLPEEVEVVKKEPEPVAVDPKKKK